MEADVAPEEGQTQEEADAKYLERIQPALADLLKQPHAPIEQVLVAGSMSAYGEGAYLPLPGDVASEDFGFVRPPEGWKPWTDIDGDVHFDFPGMEPTATPEEMSLQPASVYAWTKAEQEHLALLIGKIRGINVKAMDCTEQPAQSYRSAST